MSEVGIPPPHNSDNPHARVASFNNNNNNNRHHTLHMMHTYIKHSLSESPYTLSINGLSSSNTFWSIQNIYHWSSSQIFYSKNIFISNTPAIVYYIWVNIRCYNSYALTYFECLFWKLLLNRYPVAIIVTLTIYDTNIKR